jgi:3-oxoacyl-[acyl-carrier-protein] synthase II
MSDDVQTTTQCQHCGGSNPPSATYCMHCATRLADNMQASHTRRVVVTGLGAISSLGSTASETWTRVLAGETGIRRVTNLDPAQSPCLIRADIDESRISFRFLEGKSARNTSRFARVTVEAAGEALEDAGLLDHDLQPNIDLGLGGVLIGTCVGGTYDDLLPAYDTFNTRGPGRVPPHLHVMFPHNLAAYTIHSRFNLGGPSSTVVTACATGAQAIGDAFHTIKFGRAPIMIGGAVEMTDHPMFIAGFAAMRGAMPTDYNDHPELASRPFDTTRAGFVLGEGAGVVVLEDLEHARARGAKIYAEILGFGTSNDAYHPIAPHPEGEGAARAINAALKDGCVDPSRVGHVHAHAASTPAGDLAEANAIKLVLGERAKEIPITSVKGALGHCMGASGALETVVAAYSMAEQLIPPTRNYRNPDPEIGLDIVHGEPRKASFDVMTKHSFGLGGQNAVLVLGKAPE